MKNYLLLEDGTFYQAEFNGLQSNVLGQLSVKDNAVGLNCQATGQFIKAAFTDAEHSHLKAKIVNHKGFLGKFVVDELPMDFHVYDLKTAI